ncbi:MAG: thiol reductant ABC exporter subunit CydC [Chloroflexi bacterium]|nr:thiol reductant ABC exporter subunit CydC [Chloroflexota bacterium]
MYFDWRLIRMTSGLRGRIALAALVGLAGLPVALWRLTLTGQVMARAIGGAPFDALVGTLALIATLIVVRAVLMFVRDEVANTTAALMKVRVRSTLYEKVLSLGPAYFDARHTGASVLTLVEGVEQLDIFFGQYLPQLIVAGLTPIVIFVFMAVLDLETALIFLIFAVFTLAAPAAFHRLNSSASMGFRRSQSAMGADFLDSVQGLATLKAFGQSGRRGAELAERARHLYRSTMWVLAVNIGTGGITLLGISAGAAVALGWGAVRVENGELPLSTLLVVLLLGVEVFRPLRDLVQLYHGSMLAVAATRGMYELLDAVPAVQEPATPARLDAPVTPSVRFENVSFAYDSGRRPAIHDCSFELQAGETLGVVGPSGAGKSTLVALLLRFVDPQQGRVLLGGRDVRDLRLEELRAQVAVVAQDTYLFYGSVAENLRLAKPSATQAELEEACRTANAHEFIRALPRGYETPIGERGIRLSGGQRQRLAIARALLKDAPVLVLDEALSSVDAENESIIQQALDRLQAGRTTLVIAHRLSSVVDADRIIVLERGRLVEIGTPAELLTQQDGVYARLMSSQRAETAVVGARTSRLNGSADGAEEDPSPPAAGESNTESAHNEAVPRNVWWRLLRLVGPWWWETVFVLLLGPLQGLAQVGLGVVSALLVAQVTAHGELRPWLWALGVLVVVAAVLRWLDSFVSHDLAYRLLAELRIRLYQLLDPLAPAYLVRRRSGDLASTLLGDVELIELFYAHTISPLFVAVLVPSVVLIALLMLAPSLALILLPFVVAVALTPLLAGRQSARLGSDLRDVTGEVTAHGVDSIQGLRTIVAFGYGKARGAQLASRSKRLGLLKRDFLRWQAVQNATIEALMGLGALAVLTGGARLVVDGELQRTLLPLATLLAASAFQPVVTIVTVAKELMQTAGAARRYFSVEDEPVPVRDGPGVAATPRSARGLTVGFRDVNFSYGPHEPQALRDVSFEISAGHTVALVGRSGAGKTTSAHLLLRFWDPDRGRIELDGHDIREFRLDDLRRLVALVAQDTYLFNTSLRENIRLGRVDASDEDVLAAARGANVDEFASALPDGYDTLVGERGLQLSGGQRQRVAIARALLKDAPVLVLDEATSHLDAVSEAEVRAALDRLREGRTTLVIAHRLSTVRDADEILVLDGGTIAERGTHHELLAQDGLYSHLVASQVQAAARAPASV